MLIVPCTAKLETTGEGRQLVSRQHDGQSRITQAW